MKCRANEVMQVQEAVWLARGIKSQRRQIENDSLKSFTGESDAIKLKKGTNLQYAARNQLY